MKRFISLLIVVFMLLLDTSQAIAASFSIEYPLLEGLSYEETTGELSDGADSHTYVFRYTPGRSAFPVVSWGSSQKSRKTVLKMASLYGEEAVAGINADFFSFYTGIPLGCLVSEGRFLSSSVDNNALAVMPDGALHIGKPDIETKLIYNDKEYDFFYNKYPLVYSLYVTDDTYSSSTASDFPALEIVLEPKNNSLEVNSTTDCKVVGIVKDGFNTPIPKGSFVLTVPNVHAAFSDFEGVAVGDIITIKVSGSDPWSKAVHIIGGGEIIVENSAFVPETVNEYADKVRYARTAVGILEDGSAVFFAVNGKRESYSSGMTLKELGEHMISLGAVRVLNFDGGGSTTVGVKLSKKDEMEVVNFPTDGYPRAVSNAVLFVNTATPDGISTNVSLLPSVHFALPNTYIDVNETFYDSSMTELERAYVTKREYYPISEGVEFFDNRFVITASELSDREVGATYRLLNGKDIEDKKTIHVPSSLDYLTLSLSDAVLDAGETTDVSIYAEYYGFEVATSHGAFEWRFTENNIEAMREGVLAENDVARLYIDGRLEIVTDELFRSATLVGSYGDISAEVTVYAGLADSLLMDFEGENEDSSNAPQPCPGEEESVIEPEVTFSEGYRSKGAAVLEEGELTLETPIEISIPPRSLRLMYKGSLKDSAHLVIITSAGDEIEIPYIIMKDYSRVSGWCEIEAIIPENVKGAFFIKSPFVSSVKKRAVVDNLVASYGYLTEPFDDVSESWAKEYIRTAYDMGLISGYLENDKTLFAPSRDITRAEFIKLATSFLGFDTTKTREHLPEYNDKGEIPDWAVGYVIAAAENNIMNGRAEGDGTITFAPSSPITRAEAMLVISRIIGESENIKEPLFNDIKDVPEWSMEGVINTTSAGIITGYDDNTLRPLNNITRAEVAVIFSRLYNFVFED